MDEAVKSEAFRKVDELSRKIHADLVKGSRENSILKSDHQQIVLNAAYLVRRADGQDFLARASLLGKEYEERGLVVHSSGPWAPYSFC
jgi:hypothetical protein